LKGIERKNGELFVDNISLNNIAKDFGTPTYVYSEPLLRDNFESYSSSIRENDKVCYAVKSNSNLSILKLLVSLGSGFDVVSGNELKKCLLAGADPKKIVFSGVGKSEKEINYAIENRIFSINIESESELERILKISDNLEKRVSCSIRVNPEISSESHPYIQTALKTSKFGVDEDCCFRMAQRIKDSKNIDLIGIASHIGSQISKSSLVNENVDFLLKIINKLNNKDHNINSLDIGGGFGIRYKDEKSLSPRKVIPSLLDKLGKDKNLILEPGRSISGGVGVMLTKIEYIKESRDHNFAIVDAGMNDLIRPSLYDAWHKIEPVNLKEGLGEETYRFVGPICESADQFGDRDMGIEEGDLVAVYDVGAYGFSMSSNYNSRTKSAEILTNKGKMKVIRSRETFKDMLGDEIELLR